MGAYRPTPRQNARRRLSDGAEDCYEALPLSRTASHPPPWDTTGRRKSVILLKELTDHITDHISRYDCRQTNKHAHYNTLLPCQRRSNDQLCEMTVIHSCLFTVYCTASQNLYINCCDT